MIRPTGRSLKQTPNSSLRLGQLHKLLTARNDTAELYRYHPRLMAWLARQDDGEGLSRLLKLLRATEPTFQLNDPELALQCADTLYHAGHYRAALRLLQDFHKRFPDSSQLAPAYLLAARALANGLQQWDKASAFLQFINKRCTDHPLHQQIDSWLEQAKNHQPLKGPKANFQVSD